MEYGGLMDAVEHPQPRLGRVVQHPNIRKQQIMFDGLAAYDKNKVLRWVNQEPRRPKASHDERASRRRLDFEHAYAWNVQINAMTQAMEKRDPGHAERSRRSMQEIWEKWNTFKP